jgi:proteasome activator subunit 4
MKSSRFIKLSTMAHNDIDMVLEQNHNPHRRHVPVKELSHEYTEQFLHSFRTPPHMDEISETA